MKGTAYLLVSELAITERIFDITIKLLKKNYDDKEQLTTKLVYKLLDLTTANHNYKDLQLFFRINKISF